MENSTSNNKISIIVPVYNEEETVGASLKSIIEQSYTNIEIIVVYKESQDKSLEVIKSFNDERIKIVYQEENSGPGGARNIGIAHSTGDYIGFVECVVIDKDFYKTMLDGVLDGYCDISVCPIVLYVSNKKPKLWKHQTKKNVITTLGDKFKISNHLACFNKLFKASLIRDNKIEFAEKLRWEDTTFVFKALYFAKKIRLLNNCKYDYVATAWKDGYRDVLVDSVIPIAKIVFDFAEEENFSKKEKELLRNMIIKCFLGSFIVDSNIYQEFKKIAGFSFYGAFRYWKKKLKLMIKG